MKLKNSDLKYVKYKQKLVFLKLLRNEIDHVDFFLKLLRNGIDHVDLVDLQSIH